MMNPTILNLNENILGVQVTNFNLDVEIQYSAVVYGIDENFLMHCGISMLSIVEKTSEVPLHLFIITDKTMNLNFPDCILLSRILNMHSQLLLYLLTL